MRTCVESSRRQTDTVMAQPGSIEIVLTMMRENPTLFVLRYLNLEEMVKEQQEQIERLQNSVSGLLAREVL